MEYGPGRALVKQVNHQDNTTTLYVGSGFEQVTKDTTTTNRHHISVAGQTIAVLELSDAASPRREHYLHRDHQDSIVAITDHTGSVVERNFYDAFGKKRSAIRTLENTPMLAAGFFPVTERGYTGHRQLSPDVVHMNGRIYDPNLGRFLSADPHIQSPLNSQSLNRYSYVLNNPLSFVDPSGFFLKSLFKHLKRLFKAIVKIIKQVVNEIIRVVKSVLNFIQENWKMIAAIAIMAAAPYLIESVGFALMSPTIVGLSTNAIAIGAIGGGLAGLIMTGSIKGMLLGAISGAAFGAIGSKFANMGKGLLTKSGTFMMNGVKTAGYVLNGLGKAAQALSHGVVGGAMSALNGGKFKAGFMGAFVGKLVTFAGIDKTFGNGRVGRILSAGFAGGIAADLVGGEFKNGFWPAAYGMAFNELMSPNSTVNWFRKGNHTYENNQTICSIGSEGCVESNVVSSLNKNGLYPESSSEFFPGSGFHIADANIIGPWGADHVLTTAIYNSNGRQIGIRNETLANHILHPGVVERRVLTIDNSIIIQTSGGGFGILGGPNVWLRNFTWMPANQRVIDGL